MFVNGLLSFFEIVDAKEGERVDLGAIVLSEDFFVIKVVLVGSNAPGIGEVGQSCDEDGEPYVEGW